MTNYQRHELYLAIMSMTPEPLAADFRELTEMAVEEVERIEPLIDDMLKQAFAQGRFEGMLEVWAKHAERWHALKLPLA